ncbi:MULTISPECIES: replication restart helicase PriA [Flavobacterium]|uniref:Replication restart protein PriA n=1 Tax=Flavobacterium columnare TaxID=996 RepID=A0AA94EYW8_9FLAO|nr:MULTISPECIES: primosomal protein N' [Flavobacterium]MCH4831023.1 primosomal protein N' [Flavobacterium columnare]MCH4833035.1 primosomal protein N' [Flavobacterium columnare]OWP86407.1 primosomal protein N' [Flavobacterium covae]QYS90791.1 primosomal protein N' [Flavobacterium covae]
MRYFIEVVIPISLPQTFTYEVSEAEFYFIQIGMRVAVPFGKTKFYTGLTISKHHTAPTLYEAKEIHQIIDQIPILTTIQIEFWKWIANYYMCSLGEVYKTALPSALILESETIISAKKQVLDTTDLSDDEFLIVEALSSQTSLKISEVTAILNKKKVFPVIQSLLDKDILILQEEMIEEYKPKLVKYIRLAEKFNKPDQLEELLLLLKNAQKQKELVLNYFQLIATQKKTISVKNLLTFSGIKANTLKVLVDKQIFEEYLLQQDRIFFEDVQQNQIVLSDAQQKAYKQILETLERKEVCLLHGVTASGKTEVYIKIIEQYLKQEKQVLYLLPEIALTTQLVSRLSKHFGNKIAVYHSKYSNNERVEVWNEVLIGSEKAKVVIGARSALFLPFQKLGLIIVDEEHEQTYKQVDPAPRYHARDASIVLAHQLKAKVLLGSATPSLESYYNVQKNKYGIVELFERFGNAVLPEIILVDLKDNYFRKRMTGHFSQILIDKIQEALYNGEQIILFQNRRGYSPILECMTCGHIPQCSNCDVSLTYHKFKNQLRCHYCGYNIAKPTNCHACSSIDLTSKGFGTEQIEMELVSLFPTKNIKRMDQDTTRGKYSFERLIDDFKNKEIDILVGTQMLAKGLDFDNVSLVGILNADNMLYFPDFRAFERSYQMMTQVAGRAGRSDKKGKVVIQSYNPMHNIIQQVTDHNYLGMYKEQLYERHIYKYPPFYKLIKFTLKHKEFEKLKEGSMWFYQVLKQNLEMPVLGPEEPPISKIRNEYIRTILIKIPKDKHLGNTKKTIQKILNSFEAVPIYKSIRVGVNVDVN